MIEDVKSWLGVASLIITVGGWFWVHLTSGGTKALNAVGDLRKSVDERFVDQDEALARVEAEIERELEKIDQDARLKGEAILHRFGMLDLQIARIEAGLEHLPDRKQAHDLAMAVEKMSGQIAAMDAKLSGRIDALDERLKPVAATNQRLQEFLLEQAQK